MMMSNGPHVEFFNGATSMKTWKREEAKAYVRSALLQWGHVNEDVEEAGESDIGEGRLRLQWGHVNEDVEEERKTR